MKILILIFLAVSSAPVKSNIEETIEVDLSVNYTNNDLVNYDLDRPKEINLIVSFNTQYETIKDTVRRMWSDVITNNSYPNHIETLTSAELRLFYAPWIHSKDDLVSPFNITIYRYKNRTRNYVNSVIVEAGHQGWIEINITSLVQWWIDHPEDTECVVKMTYSMGNDSFSSLFLVDDFSGSYSHGEFSVGYYNNVLNTTDFRSNFEYEKIFPPGYDAFKDPDFCETVCRSNDIFINFKTIRPKEWIISPDGVCCFYFIVIR